MIHPTAIIHKNAGIDDDVDIGPYCIIEEKVAIRKGTKLLGHVAIQGNTTIGGGCTISPFASIGGPPQDLSYKGEDTTLRIGNNNIIKEYVTINKGSVHGGGTTVVGNNNFIMAYSHIAHDCKVGSNIIMANCATLAGHVEVADFVTFAGLCAVHQFCRIGKYAFISGITGVPKDVPPFMIAAGSRAELYGLNVVGLERRGFTKEDISQLKKAYRILFRSSLPLTTSLKVIQEELKGEHIDELIHFIQASKRGICR
ncbi:MAG TPA: acyl-ACP--UDP-N-acetylglucosamine O-acyltransferase [Syntrophorhabdaceae bacterium]|nr:acyl-ACP--UDP-N-acetylglucosamine O-acyltransferase [Syntrophorhabdaceae bacterium]HQM82705.1 acyl-ACP--UDP-N-acetylglucosamine O-acyltransferase [Syntrophorhabdaceae bacterium]